MACDPTFRFFVSLVAVVGLGCSSNDGGSGGNGDGASLSRLMQYTPPGEAGPFPIGFVTMPFIDETRPELTTTDPADNRTLPSVVWYPAAEEARDAAKSTYADYFTPAVVDFLSETAAPGFLDTESNSVKGSALADDGPFPLIVFSHGNGGDGAQSYLLTEFLASHGYIVVCPDHPGDAFLTELPGGVIVGPAGQDGMYMNDVQDRTADASFLVDAMAELDASDPAGRFTGKVDLERVGLTGHSYGGLTTLLVMEQDDRFAVGAPMAPAAPEPYDIRKPLMYFWGTEDRQLEFEPLQAHYAAVSGPKMLVTVTDAGHFSFSDACPLGLGLGDGCGTERRKGTHEMFTFLDPFRMHQIIRFYQTALWGFYLKGVDAYRNDLLAEPFVPDVALERAGLP